MTTMQEPFDTAPTPLTTPSVRRGGVLTGIYVGIGLLMIALNLRMGVASVGPVLPAIEHDLGIPAAAAGLLTTIPVFAFGAFAFLTPTLTRWIGLHRLLALTMVVVALGIGIRLLPSPLALFGGTVLVGAGIAVANVCMPAVIRQDFAHRLGLMMGLYSTALFLGAAAAAALTVPFMTALDGSWRGALAIWAIPAVLALLIWLPRAMRAITGSATAPGAPVDAIVEPRDEPRMSALLRDPVAWAVTGFMGLQSLSYYAALTWIPTILQDAGVPVSDAGLLLSYSSLPGIAAALLVPTMLRRIRPTWLPVVLSALLCAAGLIGLLVAPGGAAPWVWMTLLGLGQGAAIALSLTYIVLRAPDARHTAHLSTMAQGIGYLLAGLGPIGLGILHAAVGGWAVPVAALVLLLGVQAVAGAAASRERHVRAGRR
ncbi:MFS transporter [Microbacterium sp. ISL-59]|uniref:CynX/NimT family MFS transporter n=1 Tax=Microbacterium sp. ISL-59 TaxID=2819159 RepID=UPI001BEBB03B|nr:MFS transporter [Microbacterium sp. ISL-59]MBT2494898.1 MFS transporter [Microbacterium sp. ISL-59]